MFSAATSINIIIIIVIIDVVLVIVAVVVVAVKHYNEPKTYFILFTSFLPLQFQLISETKLHQKMMRCSL